MKTVTTLPNLLPLNRGNFYLFLLNFGYTSYYLRITSLLASGAQLLQSLSLFSQKITSGTGYSFLASTRMGKKSIWRKPRLGTPTVTSRYVASFWYLSTLLSQQKFQLIGLPYNKKRFTFLDTLTQNRLNPSLKVGTVRRHTFSKLYRTKVRFFLGALVTKKLPILTTPRLRVRRATNLRGVNPYLFLIRRSGRRTTSQTYVNYLLLHRLKGLTRLTKPFKFGKAFTPQATFYFWKRYLRTSIKGLEVRPLFRRFRKRWYRWKCLSTKSKMGVKGLRRSNVNLSTQVQLKSGSHTLRRQITHSRLLAQPFRFNSRYLDSSYKLSPSSFSSRTPVTRIFLRHKRKLFPEKITSRGLTPTLGRSLSLRKSPIFEKSGQSFLTTTDRLFFLRRAKRRSFRRGIRLQLRAKRNYVSLARKWGYLTSGTWSMGKSKNVQIAAWKGRVFWTKATSLKGTYALALRPVTHVAAFASLHCAGYWFRSLTKQQYFFKRFLDESFIVRTFKTGNLPKVSYNIKRPLRGQFSKQFISPIFSTTFTRCNFFFLYLCRGLQTYTKTDAKTDFFKTGYTFVNTSTLKRSLLRRVVRTTLQLKRLFTPQYSAQQTKLTFSNPGNLQYTHRFRSQSRLILPFYTNSRTTRIPRIRFKPGYARQWRFFRSDVKHFLGIRTRYQYRLTILIQRLFHSNRKINSWDLQTKVTPFLVQSRLVPDFWSASELLKASSVFVNGYVCTNAFLNVVFSDFVQLIINIKCYVVHKWLVNWSLRNSTRVLQLNRKFNQKKRTDGLSYKPKPLPDWIFRIRYSNYDIPRYVEVDFFTLSAFVISNTNSLLNVTSLSSQDTQFKVFNMYNWKYIT